MRLLVLNPKPAGVSPGQRFRLEQWAPHLAADHGITLDFVPFESPQLTAVLYEPKRFAEKAAWTLWDFVRRARTVVEARRYDAVVVYREAALLGPAIYERIFARTGTPLFFDFDDAIWQPSQQSGSVNGVFSHLHFWGKTATTTRLASGVIVGNAYLARWARAYNPHVFVVPTSIELGSYPVQPALPDDEPFTIGWSGSISTLAHFEHAREALERFAAHRPLRVVVVCNRAPATPIRGAENVFVPWHEDNEAEVLGRCHAGIMPLPDTDYTRGKCGLKALQYMAVGRPVVLSPVGMNVDLVQSGENGILASTNDEWVEAFERLADDPALGHRLGAAARATVESAYSAHVAAARFADAVRVTIEGRR